MTEDWLSDALVSLTGTADWKTAAARMAEHEVGLLRSDRIPSVFEIAERYNVFPLVRDLAYGPAGAVGGFEGKYLISLNANDSEARRRFTLAHEIGHIVIAKAAGRDLGEAGGARVERLLDEFASRIVLPDRLLDEWREHIGGNVSIRALEEATKKLDVSMTVLVKRLGQGNALDWTQKAIIVGAVARSRKAKREPTLRIQHVATPSWGFIPLNRRLSSVGLGASSALFAEAVAIRRTSAVARYSAKIMVKRTPKFAWTEIDSIVENRAYRTRAGEYYLLAVFDWPSPAEEESQELVPAVQGG